MVVSGLPIPNGNNHAGEIASMSLDLLNCVKTFKIRHKPNMQMQLRVGIHSGIVYILVSWFLCNYLRVYKMCIYEQI